MIYIASPYTALVNNSDSVQFGERDEVVEHKRYIEVSMACGFLMMEGKLVYSPIAHWHLIDKMFKGSLKYEDYLANDCNMIDRCDELHVCCIDGWALSSGVRVEIEYAKMKGKPIKYFTVSSEGVKYDCAS